MLLATHSGVFHADDVLAHAMITAFLDPDATVIRTRDEALLAQADLVYDVGGEYDPNRLRFDHHQAEYKGHWSSAGMVLAWLEREGKVDADLAAALRAQVVDYVDAVDNGRTKPQPGVPCLATLVGYFYQGCEKEADFDAAYLKAAALARQLVEGIARGEAIRRRSAEVVLQAMKRARTLGSNLIRLDRFYPWKQTYYAHGGQTHPTEFVLIPGEDGQWRVTAIPPQEDSFEQKRPFPEAWAGLSGEALSEVIGVPGAIFCHKNRFIAVFQSELSALEALSRWGLLEGGAHEVTTEVTTEVWTSVTLGVRVPPSGCHDDGETVVRWRSL